MSYAVIIPSRPHPLGEMTDIHWSAHTTYDKETRKLTLTRGHMGLHAACLFRLSELESLTRQCYFKEAMLLVGGDFTGDCKPWVAILPIYPGHKNKALQQLSKSDTALKKEMAWRSSWVIGGDESILSELGRRQIMGWFLDEESWVQKPRGVYETALISYARTVGLKVYVSYARPAQKAFAVWSSEL